MKKAKILLVFILIMFFVTPCLGTLGPEYQAYTSTQVSLRDYIEKLFDAQNRYIERRLADIDRFNESRFAASEKALDVSKVELDRRFVLLSDYGKESTIFKRELSDITSNFAMIRSNVERVANYDGRLIQLEKDISVIKKQLEKEDDSNALWLAWAASFIFILIVALLNYISRKVTKGKE